MTYLEKAQDLYRQIGEGKIMDAFEQYYHDNVHIVEARGDERHGKDAQRDAIKEWGESIEEMHGGGVTSITSDEANGVTMVETWTDNTFKGGGRMKFEEVCVQKWEGDKIIHERFYYNMPG